MAAVVRIDGESRGAQEAIQKVSTDLRGMASTATAASTQASSALGGMAASFGRMTTAVFLGGSAVEVARKGLQFLISSTADYIATNEEAQQQTAALTGEFGDFRQSVGRVIVTLGQGTGAIGAMTSAFGLFNRAVEMAFNPLTNERINSFVAALAPIAGITTDVRDLTEALLDAELAALDASIATRAMTIAQAQQQLAEANAQYLGTSYYNQVVTQAPAVMEAQRDLNAELERRNQIEAEILERRRSGASGEIAGGLGGRAGFAGGAVDVSGLLNETAQAAGGAVSAIDAVGAAMDSAMRGAGDAYAESLAQLEKLATNVAAAHNEAAIAIKGAAFEAAALARQSEDAKAAEDARLDARRKAGDMAEQSEAAAAALELVRSRQGELATAFAQSFAGLADANEKFSKSVVKSTANQLAVKGVEGIFEGAMMALRGNPLGVPLGLKGFGALLTARGLGSTISEGGGRGVGTPAAPITNNNVSVRVVAPNGMTSDQAAYVSAAAEEGARRGLRQDRR